MIQKRNMKKLFLELKSEIETINGGKELFYKQDYAKIWVDTDDDIPLNKLLSFPSLTIIFRCFFQNGKNCTHKFI